MMIGKFRLQGDYMGNISALALTLYGVTIRPIAKKAGTSQPDFTVFSDSGAEIGAGWKKISQKGKSYVSVQLDGPTLAAPVDCALMPQPDETYALIWNRNGRKGGAATIA